MSWGYFEYVPVAKKKADIEKPLEKLKKKNPNIFPVIIEGKKIANTWWGIAWNKNLESYADYSNRIRRGRYYVKNGMVLDLRISSGYISGLVKGSSSRPYKVEIRIDKLSAEKWDSIFEKCSRKINNMEDLINGKFPKEFEEIFLQKGSGLFPSPREINLDCDCPDWAEMCKHIAAVLYGIGARLDSNPLMFFELRGIDYKELVKKSMDEKISNMLKNAENKSDRIIEDKNILDLFGV